MKSNTETRDHVVKVYLSDTEKSFLRSVYGPDSELGPLLRNAGKSLAAYRLQHRNHMRRSGRSEGPLEGLGRAFHLPGRSHFVAQRMSFRS